MIARPVAPGDPRLVLVVDDDDGIRAVLRELLQEEHYGVETAENGAEALTSLRTGALSRVILLDLTMPVVDGRAVYRQLADDPVLFDHHHLIICSSQPATGVEFPLAAAILHKPFDIEHVLAAVARLSGRSIVA